MLTDPSSPQMAAVQALVVAAAALCFGRLVAGALIGRREVDGLNRWALAFPGLVFFSFAVMLLHLATGGAVLSNAWLTRALVLGATLALVVTNFRRRPPPAAKMPRWQVWTVVGACALGIVVWGLPIASAIPLHFTPDTNLHMGWATQLMIGESSPSSVVTGDIPGYYPWLYHALVALLARFTPGGRAFDTLGALQLLQVVGTVLGLFAMGKYMTDKFKTGAAAAFFGALCGGFGVGMLFDHDLLDRAASVKATKIPWLGDVLSRRPYNFAFNNLAPPYPRDLSFTLLIAFLLLLLIGFRRKSFVALGAAGVALGLVGLAGGEAVIVGFAVAVVVCLAQQEMPRIKAGAAVLVPMGLVYGAWLVPLFLSYIDLGGFVNTTHVGPVLLSFSFLILSWGLVIPFAVLGLAVNLKSIRKPGVLIPTAIVGVTALIMASNAIPEAFGSAFLTLGRDHRYWALCQLGVALWAALGATRLLDLIGGHRAIAAGVAIVIVALGVVSPIVGSAVYREKYPPDPVIGASLEGRQTLLNAMAPAADRRCVAAVPGNGLAREAFAYTGYRLVQWVAGQTKDNWARIRWRNIYRVIPGDRERAADNEVLTRGLEPRSRWLAVAEKYGVNFVIVPQDRAASPVFEGYESQQFVLRGAPVTLVRVKDC